jgi:hypothetical protein
MLEIVGTIFGSIFSGGATGLLGVIFQRFADYKNKQLDIQVEAQKQANAIAMKEVDAKIMAQEWAARLQVTQTEVEGRSDVASTEAFAKSYELEPKLYATGKLSNGQRWVMVCLDAVRGLVRPVLTIYLCILTTLVYWEAKTLMTPEAGQAAAYELTKLIVGSILYLTTTCVLWWFGTRNSDKKEPK